MSSIASPTWVRYAWPGRARMSRVHKAAPRILVVDADPALLGPLEEWLGGQGWRVVADLAKEILALRNGGRP